MKGREIEEAIAAEVEQHWPDAKVEIERGKGHPKARLEFGGLILRCPFPGTPGDRRSLAKSLGDVRRALRKLGAERAKPESKDEDEAEAERIYRPPNDGKAKRPDPVAGEKARPKPSVGEQMAGAGLIPAEDREAVQAEGSAETYRKAEAIREIAPEPERISEAERLRQIKAAATLVEDGIYFGLDEEVYHAVERLSTSGMQAIEVSPGDFWRDSWLNPAPPKLTEEQQKNREKTRRLGRAYHCARLEPEEFERRFYRRPDKGDFLEIEGVIWNGTQAGEALADYGDAKKRAGENVIAQCQRLEECGYPHPIWPLEEWRAEQDGRGKAGIEGKFWDDIATDMERLRNSVDVHGLLAEGQAEVSIFWTDPNYRMPMKARVDWLAEPHWVDFKTFDNSRGKVLRQAIAEALRFNRYHMQAVSYRDAVEAIRVGGLQIRGEASEAARELIARIQLRPAELDCWFVFQQKNGVPNLLGRRFPFFSVPLNVRLQHAGASEEGIERVEAATRTRTALHIRAMQDIDHAKREFLLYSQVYPPGQPWAPIEPLSDFEDADFNRYWLEGRE